MDRIHSIDVVRLFAITAVIALHTAPFSETQTEIWVVINQATRFAVPFFFVISGYLFAKKVQQRDLLVPVSLGLLKRLVAIWAFWSLIYTLPYELNLLYKYGFVEQAIRTVNWKLAKIAADPILFAFQGTKIHLWFIVSLALAIAITALYLRYWPSRSLYPLVFFSIMLYFFGMCAYSYSVTPIGINFDFNTRNGPFFSLIFFVTGYILSQFTFWPRHLYYGVAIMIIGYAIQFIEVSYLYSAYRVFPTNHDYVIGTFFTGGGAAIIALSNHSLLHIRHLSRIGKYTLGVYAIHYIFVDIFYLIVRNRANPFWEVGYVLIILIFSVASTLILSKFKPLKKFVV